MLQRQLRWKHEGVQTLRWDMTRKEELAKMKRQGIILGNERGFTMFATLLLLMMLLALATVSLIQTSVDLRTTTHYQTGVQAMATAEAGVLHAIHEMNKHTAWNLQSQITTNSWNSTNTG